MEEVEKESRVVLWVRKHLWLLTIIIGGLVLLSFFGPFLQSRPVAFDGLSEDGIASFSRLASERSGVWAINLFSPVVVWPVVIEYSLVLIGMVLGGVGKANKYFSFVSMMLFIVAGIMFLLNAYFFDFSEGAQYVPNGQSADVLDCYMPGYADAAGTELAFGSIFGGVFSFIAAFVAFGSASSQETYSVRDLTEIGILVASAIGLHYVKIEIGTSGGSINLAPIPLFILALRHGAIKGFFAAGIVYGLIACVLSGWGLITYPLDYLVGWGSFAILGLFRKLVFSNSERRWSPMGFFYIFLGVILATLVRYVGSSASSMINYGYSFKAAIVYNVVYVPVTAAVALVAMEALYIPLAKLDKFFPIAQ